MVRIDIVKVEWNLWYVRIINKETGLKLSETSTDDHSMLKYIVDGYKKQWQIRQRIDLSYHR